DGIRDRNVTGVQTCALPISEAEWRSVGVPDLSGIGKDVVFLEWVDSSGRPNPDFARDLAAKVPGGPVVFLCRSGNRSIPAAQTRSAERRVGEEARRRAGRVA